MIIHCRRCFHARQVASTRGLETGHCPLCQRDGRIEPGWLYPEDVEAIEDAERLTVDELLDELLRAQLQEFETRVAFDDHALRAALATIWESLDYDHQDTA